VTAQHVDTIRGTSQVLVINDDRIIERGKHDGLSKQHEFNCDLCESQSHRAVDFATDVVPVATV
jgi:ABC-type multidrug transport system fused ATPase/permease subunit